VRVLKIQIDARTGPRAPAPNPPGESYVVVRMPGDASLVDTLEVVSRKLERELSPLDYVFETCGSQTGCGRMLLDRCMKVSAAPAVLRLASASQIAFCSSPRGPAQAPSARPPATVFTFNESSACVLTEYAVRVEQFVRVEDVPAWPRMAGERKPSSSSSSNTPRIQLAVCYPRVLHRFGNHAPKARRRKWAQLWGLAPDAELSALEDLHIEDVKAIDCGAESEPTIFRATYRLPRDKLFAVQYRAETPTDCALIVAHIQYLRELPAALREN
jgi:hypothetical protein